MPNIKTLYSLLLAKIKRIKLYQYLLLAIFIHIILAIWFHYILVVRPKGPKTLFASKIIRPTKKTVSKAAPRKKRVVKKVSPTARKIPAKMIPAPPKAKRRIAVKNASKAIPMAASKMADIKPKALDLAKYGRGGAGTGAAGGLTGIGTFSGKGLYASRGNRDGALRAFGGSDETESAVIKALEWLKKNQLPDGSWKSSRLDTGRCAISGLALMCFLGHGETHRSPKYGKTVKKTIDYLVNHIGKDGLVIGKERDCSGGTMYAQTIATFALGEAYTMTKLPSIKKKLKLMLEVLLKAQKIRKGSEAQGGWRYHPNSRDSDLSITGWAAMAIKSCRLAGLEVPTEAIKGITTYVKNCYVDPGFYYTAAEWRGRDYALCSAGVFLLQLFGEGKSKEAQKTLKYMRDKYKCGWEYGPTEAGSAGGKCLALYAWYYTTLAMFNAGAGYWDHWNKQMKKALIKNQHNDGHWNLPPKSFEWRELYGVKDCPAYSTTLCCLMLEVYYRYMPIYRSQ